MRRDLVIVLACGVAIFASCGDDASSETGDAGHDVETMDAAPDVATDTFVDTTPDAPDTSAPDTSPDVDTLRDTTPSDVDTTDADPLAEPIVLITQLVHLEGWQVSDPEVFARYATLLRERAALYERHGARLTLESKELTAGAIRWGDNVLAELKARGHDVAIHADLGGSPDPSYTGADMTADLLARQAELGELGLEARHVSGICSSLDWVAAVADAGFEAVSGLVAYCLMSLPQDLRPPEYQSCPSPAACHDAWPPDTASRIHPYRVHSGADWTTPTDDGRLTVVPQFGALPCLAEEATDDSPTQCALDTDDIDAFEAIMTSAVALAVPGRVNVVGLNWSFGSPLDLPMLERVLAATDAWVARGEARYATVAEVLDLYALERGGPTPLDTLAPGSSARLRVPTAAAPGNGVLVEVRVPDAPRWAQAGAPVAIVLPGGHGTSGLADRTPDLVVDGFVEVRVSFPGDVAAGNAGQYDNRGTDTITAMADVIRWCRGEATDAEGRTLADHLGPETPLASVLGLVGLSNGGNLTLATTALGGARVDFVANWESPVGDGMIGVEAGSNDKLNPAYDPDAGTWDLSTLAWSDTLPIGQGPTPLYTGGLYFDFDRDGVVDLDGPSPDFVTSPLVGFESGAAAPRAWWSIRLLAAATSAGLLPSPAPAHLPTLTDATAFWSVRDASHQLAAVAETHPDLLFIVVASQIDHVQGQPDHPHVLAQYEGLRTLGVWSRLGADRAYLAAVAPPSAPFLPDAPDNAANAAFDHATIRAALDPETIPYVFMLRAAVSELADRVRHADRRTQLDAILP